MLRCQTQIASGIFLLSVGRSQVAFPRHFEPKSLSLTCLWYDRSMDRMYNVTYILKCKDGSLYTGWTNDMKKRYAAHAAGKGGKYTKSHPPVGIAYLEVLETKEEAMRREFAIKQMTRKKKEELIATADWRAALPEELKETFAEYMCALTEHSA